MDELYEKRVPAWKMKGYVTEVETNHQASKQSRQAVNLESLA
jgi:hypothetical protein